MKAIHLIYAVALFGAAAAGQQQSWPLAKLTVRAIDEQGQPVPAAKVKIGFREKLSNQDVWATGDTDTNGTYTAEGYSDMRLLSGVSKQGYYRSSSLGTIFTGSVSGKWQPWNPMEDIILRPIGNPVALCAKRVQTEIPGLDQPYGYDFEKGDWVTPHGKGIRSDLTFKVRREYKDSLNFTVEAEVTFAQPLDGLVRMKSPDYARHSVFRWERLAPETGFTAPHLIRFVNHDPKTYKAQEKTFDTTKDREQGYFLRVRTVEADGKIIAANYAKITGDIAIDPRDSTTCMIMFTYYLNPNSLDQNLECDPRRNLLKGLSVDESPRNP